MQTFTEILPYYFCGVMVSFLYLGNINCFFQKNYNETHNNLAKECKVIDHCFFAVVMLLLPSFFVLL